MVLDASMEKKIKSDIEFYGSKIAYVFQGGVFELNDFRQDCWLAIFNAEKRHNPEISTRTYFRWQIFGVIKKYCKNGSRLRQCEYIGEKEFDMPSGEIPIEERMIVNFDVENYLASAVAAAGLTDEDKDILFEPHGLQESLKRKSLIKKVRAAAEENRKRRCHGRRYFRANI